MANQEIDGIRVADARLKPDEAEFDRTLRPKTFREYVGQDKIKQSLAIAIQAAKQRKEPLDHILLFGPPGLGKTTLAYIIAAEMGGNLRTTSGSAIARPGDLASIVTNLNDGDILFIDEIHRLGRQVEEVLYSAMEDYAIDIIIGKGPAARSLRIDIAKFTLIGATTRAGALSSPLRDRFGSTHRLDFYQEEDIEAILERSAKILHVELSPANAKIIAHAARRTPRTANRILKRVRDFAEAKNGGKITPQIITEALELMTIDADGLDFIDRKILDCLIRRFNGGPAGIAAIAAAIAEERQTLEEVYEPYLLQSGFINRTAQGRVATHQAYQHLGLQAPATPMPQVRGRHPVPAEPLKIFDAN